MPSPSPVSYVARRRAAEALYRTGASKRSLSSKGRRVVGGGRSFSDFSKPPDGRQTVSRDLSTDFSKPDTSCAADPSTGLFSVLTGGSSSSSPRRLPALQRPGPIGIATCGAVLGGGLRYIMLWPRSPSSVSAPPATSASSPSNHRWPWTCKQQPAQPKTQAEFARVVIQVITAAATSAAVTAAVGFWRRRPRPRRNTSGTLGDQRALDRALTRLVDEAKAAVEASPAFQAAESAQDTFAGPSADLVHSDDGLSCSQTSSIAVEHGECDDSFSNGSIVVALGESPRSFSNLADLEIDRLLAKLSPNSAIAPTLTTSRDCQGVVATTTSSDHESISDALDTPGHLTNRLFTTSSLSDALDTPVKTPFSPAPRELKPDHKQDHAQLIELMQLMRSDWNVHKARYPRGQSSPRSASATRKGSKSRH